MYCLAATQKLYGTNWSTFSVISAELSDIPITKVGTGKKKKEKIGIVTAAMNREAILKIALASWLVYSEISEIVIIDWNSENSLTYLEKLDPRIRVIRVENQKYFNLGKAYNLGFNESTCDKILKLDVDYILNPYCSIFKSGVQLTKKNFITGNWRDGRLDNEIGFLSHLNGFVYLYRDSFFHAGGYSKFDGYGWDDDDLYNKLEKAGYVRDFIKLSSSGKPYIYHNPHDDSFRSENYMEKDIKKSAEINRNLASTE
ncbi:MAG: glycosyltransferase family 2 protein [Flavobacteriia bacterium]|nr:glycosyltransferase family 2 protein [Flavobacteriia bacterium]